MLPQVLPSQIPTKKETQIEIFFPEAEGETSQFSSHQLCSSLELEPEKYIYTYY